MNSNSKHNLSIETSKKINIQFKRIKNRSKYKGKKKYSIILILLLIIANYYIIFNYSVHKQIFHIKKTFNAKPNIYYNDQFFQLREVKNQMHQKKLKKVKTISGGYGKIGNALMMLNNLLNICINIKCKNVISPGGLDKIIRRPIIYKDYNIKIFPNKFKHKPRIDITLKKRTIFWFNYRKKPHVNRIKIIRNEVLRNVPKLNINNNDLVIHMRSGDIFKKTINNMYSQPPLCFYRKIINENNFDRIYILSNGRENPCINKLLRLYPKARYFSRSLLFDISVIINAYNFVMSVSTFAMTIINLNNKLQNLYVYELLSTNKKNNSYTLHIMKPSVRYRRVMYKKWKKSKKQLGLMINEDCINSQINSIPPNSY